MNRRQLLTAGILSPLFLLTPEVAEAKAKRIFSMPETLPLRESKQLPYVAYPDDGKTALFRSVGIVDERQQCSYVIEGKEYLIGNKGHFQQYIDTTEVKEVVFRFGDYRVNLDGEVTENTYTANNLQTFEYIIPIVQIGIVTGIIDIYEEVQVINGQEYKRTFNKRRELYD